MRYFDNFYNIIDATVTRKIIVTAAQRSGTTIAAKIIADDMDIPFIDEKSIDVDDLEKFFRLHDRNGYGYVLQAPGLSYIAHRLPVDLVVFMQRSISDIYISEKRINWDKEWNDYESCKYFVNEPARLVKYRVWETFQKPYMIENNKKFFELEYKSLMAHPLWIDKSERINFTPKQTK